MIGCGETPSKKKVESTTNNANTNNTTTCDPGCAANEECIDEADGPICQCLPGYSPSPRGCFSANEPPTVSDVKISPSEPLYPGQTLTCDYEFTDPDGDSDSSRIEWFVDDRKISSARAFTAYLEGEEVVCRVTGNDGLIDGNTAASEPLIAPLRTLISAGTSHTCIRTRAGAVKCWGDNSYYRLGSTTAGIISTPVSPPGLESGVDGIYSGERHTCALKDDAVLCWGKGGDGVAGASAGDVATPQVMLEGDIKAVVSGNNHVCAIQGSTLKCWGVNFFGQVGVEASFGSFEGISTPTTVIGMASGVSAVAAGEDHTCAIKNAQLYCWGSNSFGELGVGEMPKTYEPQLVLDSPVVSIHSGGAHSCANHDGILKCWGSNYDKQLGFNSTLNIVSTPTPMTVVDGPFDNIFLGGGNTCVQQSGVVKCWGNSEDGQLKTTGTSASPLVMIADGTTAFSVGYSHMCGEKSGILSCWGGNLFGQTGDPSTAGSFDPDPTPFVINY